MADDEGWEARMAARARARREARGEHLHDEAADEDFARFVAAERANPENTWSAEETWARSPDVCRDCFEARPYPPGQEHFGWALWLTCDMARCPHAHHDEEMWLAQA